MLGLFAFFYGVLHLLSWAVFDLGLDLSLAVSEVVKRPYLLVGMSALLLMLPLAATSTDRMMRRLRRRWTQLHRLVYVVAVLGAWHFWWQVKRDIREPLAYAALLALLLAWRYFWPRWRSRVTSTSGSATAPGRT